MSINVLKILNDVYNNSLEDDELKVYTPIDNVKVPLRRHQHAVIEKMIEYENSFLKGYEKHSHTLFSKYAVLGDNVGVGKTLMILGHISSIKNNSKHMPFKLFDASSSKNFYSIVNSTVNDLSNAGCLIIVPHTLFRQWDDEISTKTNLKFHSLKTKKHVSSESFYKNVTEADVILVSNTLYKDLYIRSEELGIKWNRIYIDEADTIELTSTFLRKDAPTNFIWLITASFTHLLFPQNYSLYISLNQYNLMKNNNNLNNELDLILQKCYKPLNGAFYLTSYVRSLRFLSQILNDTHNMRGHLVIRCSKTFIDKSIQLPQLFTLNVLCKPSIAHQIVYDVIGSNVKQLLNAGDIKSALEILGVKTENNQSLIEAVNEAKLKELERLEKTYNFKQSLEYVSQQAKESSLKNLKEKIDHIKDQICTFKQRVENYKEDVCPICYDEPNDPLLTNCCSRIFCALCILQSLARNTSCPLCRTTINPCSLKKITTENVVVTNKKSEENTNEPKKKIDAFFDIIEKNPKGKFLVFSRYDNSFIEIISGCATRNLVTKELKGSKDMIACTLNNFREGTVNLLLMNTIQMGAGLNITDATHVILLHSMTHEEEKQILGRAYRVGRKNELYFIRLLHPDEQ
uniref:RING-type domain-containing protein n=1 Tax=viral metagenome TaxID=1070528 RepID=A0A6C0D5A5_9ZZZZ